MRTPTLSVGIPNFNHGRYLPEQLESILNQSHSPFEVIVLDDGSTDDSIEVVERYSRKNANLRLERNERNLGPNPTVNRLVRLLKGEYVYLPSADDRVLPEFFKKSMRLLAQYPSAGLCSAREYLITESGKRRGTRSLPIVSSQPRYFSQNDVRKLLRNYGRWFETTSVIYRRDALVHEGGFREEIGSFSDNFINLVISLKWGACYIPEVLSCWRQMATGYGSSFEGGWEGILSRGLCVSALMRTEYRDVFPSEFVNVFESHWRYMACRNAGQGLRRAQEDTLTLSLEGACRIRCLSDSVFRAVMRSLSIIQSIIWRAYFAARFGPCRWWFFGRVSIFLRTGKLVVSEELDG